MIQLSLFNAAPLPDFVDDFKWLSPLQAEIDEVQEQIDISAVNSEDHSKKSAEYKLLQKHNKVSVEQRANIMCRHQVICAGHGYILLPCAEVSEDGNQLRYIYRLQKK